MNKRMVGRVIVGLLLGCGAATAAEETDDAFARQILGAFESGEAAASLPAEIGIARAYAIQREYVGLLGERLGAVAGYKAALSDPKQQAQFGISEPVRGVLLAKMLLPNASRVPARFGVKPFMEGDFIVRVGNAAINEATAPEGVLAGLDAVIPFIELVDIPIEGGARSGIPNLIAANSGARSGVLGEPVPIDASPDWMQRLGRVRVELYENGLPVSSGVSTQLAGHPVAAVTWLRDSLAKEGIRLKPGDLLSLGSVAGGMKPINAGAVVTARYLGLRPDDAPAEVTATFE